MTKKACLLTVFVYLGVALPLALYLGFVHDKGNEGLRVGILVGQILLIIAYSVLIDGVTNWEDVYREAQRRLYLDIDYEQLAEDREDKETSQMLGIQWIDYSDKDLNQDRNL